MWHDPVSIHGVREVDVEQQDVLSVVAAVGGLIALVAAVFGGMVSLGCTMCGGAVGVTFALVVLGGSAVLSLAGLGLSVFARQRAVNLGIPEATANIRIGLSGGATVLVLLEGLVVGGLVVLAIFLYMLFVMM
jgi:hypothetical protein